MTFGVMRTCFDTTVTTGKRGIYGSAMEGCWTHYMPATFPPTRPQPSSAGEVYLKLSGLFTVLGGGPLVGWMDLS